MKGEIQMKIIKALSIILTVAFATSVAKTSNVGCEEPSRNNYTATAVENESLRMVENLSSVQTKPIRDTLQKEYPETVKSVLANKPIKTVKFTSLGVPNINSSFKTWMSYRAVTNKNSPQYKLINTYGWVDSEGFMRCSSGKEWGIDQNYYMIALGSYYGTTIGTKYRITLDTGKVFYGVLADCKANKHTNKTNQYARNNDVVEFIVDTKKLNSIKKTLL